MVSNKKIFALLSLLLSLMSLKAAAQDGTLIPFQNGRGKWGYKYEAGGKWIVRPVYDVAGYFCDGMAAVGKTEGWRRSETREILGEKCYGGYLGSDGKVVVPLMYESTYDFSDGMGRVRIWIEDGDMVRRLSSRWLYGFVDLDGRLVVPCMYPYAEDFHNGRALVRWLESGAWHEAYIDRSGEICSDVRTM